MLALKKPLPVVPSDSHWLHWQALANVPWIAWASVAYLGWAATIVGYALWTQLLQRHPANRVAPFSLAVPVVGLTAGGLVLGESVSSAQLVGGAVILFGLAIVSGLGLPRWKPA